MGGESIQYQNIIQTRVCRVFVISWNLERGLMIHFLLLQNRQGQTRLSRWYVPVKAEEKGKIESEVHRMITSRPSKFSNFINVRFLSL